MTKQFYITGTHKPDYCTYGGKIYLSDFETDFPPKPDKNNGSITASYIMDAWSFDKQCKKNIEIRDNQKNYNKGRDK
jgi:hypothetical protein